VGTGLCVENGSVQKTGLCRKQGCAETGFFRKWIYAGKGFVQKMDLSRKRVYVENGLM